MILLLSHERQSLLPRQVIVLITCMRYKNARLWLIVLPHIYSNDILLYLRRCSNIILTVRYG